MKIRDRVKELRRVKASELLPNPKNWRTHPRKQRDALKGILAEIGYADALIARELEDGSLQLIDGHLRAETTPDQEVPVLVLDVNEVEAKKLLLSLDPLAELAEKNDAMLSELLSEVNTGNDSLGEMWNNLLAEDLPTMGEDNAEIGEEDSYEDDDEEALPEELRGKDLTPDDMEKLKGDDTVAMERIIIVYPKDKTEMLARMLGLESVSKVVYSIDEIPFADNYR